MNNTGLIRELIEGVYVSGTRDQGTWKTVQGAAAAQAWTGIGAVPLRMCQLGMCLCAGYLFVN